MKWISALILSCSLAKAVDVTLGWDPNTDYVTGYKLYAGTNSGVYHLTNDVGNVTRGSFTNLAFGAWYFAATAYATYGTTTFESGFSAEVIASFPPKPPMNLQINQAVGTNTVSFIFTNLPSLFTVEWSPDLESWNPFLFAYPGGPNDIEYLSMKVRADAPMRFWRRN